MLHEKFDNSRKLEEAIRLLEEGAKHCKYPYNPETYDVESPKGLDQGIGGV